MKKTAVGLKTRLKDLEVEIEKSTNFSISFEGVYKWIVFDYSKSNPTLPALNRYFGVFEDGTIKMRGIETRKHDTPPLFVNFQQELVNIMATCGNINEIIIILYLFTFSSSSFCLAAFFFCSSSSFCLRAASFFLQRIDQ